MNARATPEEISTDLLTKIIENKPLTVAARFFMILGGLLAALFVWIANGAITDIHDTKSAVTALQLQLTPQISEMQAEIRDMKNASSIDRDDIHRLQDHVMSGSGATAVVVTPTRKSP